MNYLHTLTPAMLHRDLKSHNVMLTDQLKVQLVDFGLATVKNVMSTASVMNATLLSNNNNIDNKKVSPVGTYAYMAPELFSLSPQYSNRSDMWAFGVVLVMSLRFHLFLFFAFFVII